jgi:hypothetical protein
VRRERRLSLLHGFTQQFFHLFVQKGIIDGLAASVITGTNIGSFFDEDLRDIKIVVQVKTSRQYDPYLFAYCDVEILGGAFPIDKELEISKTVN